MLNVTLLHIQVKCCILSTFKPTQIRPCQPLERDTRVRGSRQRGGRPDMFTGRMLVLPRHPTDAIKLERRFLVPGMQQMVQP